MQHFLDDVPARSQTSHVYRQLRGEILQGGFQPGERLKIAELATRFEVRTGAIREALSRLVPEQLVLFRDQRGFVVAPLSVKDLRDLTDLRCDIEAIALRRSVELGRVAWEGRVIASAHLLNATPRLTDRAPPTLNPDWVAYHRAFHLALVSACGNDALIDLHGQLFERSDRYRSISVQNEIGERSVRDEHERITKAALERDVETLVETVVSHIRLTSNLIIANASPTVLS